MAARTTVAAWCALLGLVAATAAPLSAQVVEVTEADLLETAAADPALLAQPTLGQRCVDPAVAGIAAQRLLPVRLGVAGRMPVLHEVHAGQVQLIL